MSVYIPGMEMPTGCVYRENGHFTTCPLYDIDGYCEVLNKEAKHTENDILSDCPLIPVPPHGALVDALEVINTFPEEFIFTNEQARALTNYIIPADKGGDV